MYYFCTYFDSGYLARGLALYASLKEHCPAFRLWVLCLDRVCHDVLARLGLTDMRIIALEEFEKGDVALLHEKQNRSSLEYYFTCTPSLPLFVLQNNPEVNLLTYLDADLFFYGDPQPLYDEMAGHSIGIIAHRFPETLRYLEVYGIYNVGWASFLRDEHALACLRWWRGRCLEWCFDRCEDGLFADQKYLDDWPTRFQGVVTLQHKGANVAPWNLANYHVHQKETQVLIDEQPLMFFHFHGFKQIRKWLYDPSLSNYGIRPSKVVQRHIYVPYIRELIKGEEKVKPLWRQISLRNCLPRQPEPTPLGRQIGQLRWLKSIGLGILLGRYILLVNGRAL